MEKLSKVSSPTAPCREGFLLIWELGTWAWLRDVTLSRGLCFSSLSLPICTVGMLTDATYK